MRELQAGSCPCVHHDCQLPRAQSSGPLTTSKGTHSMARTDNDTWNIDESVGMTALIVAGGRAAETRSADPLISDPCARLFLEAAGDGVWSAYLADERPPELAEIDPRFGEHIRSTTSYLASRTKYFDDFFLAAAASGIRQSVILAA